MVRMAAEAQQVAPTSLTRAPLGLLVVYQLRKKVYLTKVRRWGCSSVEFTRLPSLAYYTFESFA